MKARPQDSTIFNLISASFIHVKEIMLNEAIKKEGNFIYKYASYLL
jgi:hypothetical protein